MDYEERFDSYINKAEKIIDDLFSAMTPIYKVEHRGGLDVVVPLFRALHYSTKSIFTLLLNHAMFDADVLFRTVLEGTIKYCYLMTGTLEQRAEKYVEYKIILTDIGRLHEHKKAIEAVKIIKEFSNNDTRPIEMAILEEDELLVLKAKYPAKLRDEVQQRWSYKILLLALATESEIYRKQLGTLWSYAHGSHQTHYDYFGLFYNYNGFINDDRNTIDLYSIGSGLRLLVSTISLESLRIQEYMRCNNFSQKSLMADLLKLDELVETISNELHNLIEVEFRRRNI